MATLMRERTHIGKGLWRQWVLANVGGFTVGGALAGAATRALGRPFYGLVHSVAEAVPIQVRNAGVALTVWGVVVGTMQWLVLRHHLKQTGWWIPATIVGWGLSGGVAGSLSGLMGGAVTSVGPNRGLVGFFVAALLGAVAVGFLPGASQWLVLRRQIPRARSWLLGTAGGFVAGAAVAAVVVRWGLVSLMGWLRPEDFPSANSWVLMGAVMGLLYGAITGSILTRLLRPTALAQAEAAAAASSHTRAGSSAVLPTVTIFGVAYFAGTLTLMHILRPELNPLNRYGSEYAIGRFGYLMTTAFLALAGAGAALTLSLGRTLTASVRSRTGVIFLGLFSLGILIAGIFPTDLVDDPPTSKGGIHDLASLLSFVSLVIAVILLSLTFRLDTHWRGVTWLTNTLSGALMMSFLVFFDFADAERAGVGLVQRVFITLMLGWMTVVAVRLLSLGRQAM